MYLAAICDRLHFICLMKQSAFKGIFSGYLEMPSYTITHLPNVDETGSNAMMKIFISSWPLGNIRRTFWGFPKKASYAFQTISIFAVQFPGTAYLFFIRWTRSLMDV